MEIINQIRNQFDPLAQMVRPHITLVFPFEHSMSNDDLAEILDVRLKSVKPFDVSLGSIRKQVDSFGNYLLFEVSRGVEEIRSIHKTLYHNEFKEFDLGLAYIPHLTVGKLPTVQLLDEAYDKIKFQNVLLRTVVNKISVEMIGENEESIIIFEKQLEK